MLSLKKKMLIIGGAAAAVLAAAAASFGLYTTTYVSMTETMLHIMETEEAPEIEDSGEDDPEPPIPDLPFDSDIYFDELHKMIAETDLSAIPDDARLPDEVGLLIPTANNSAWTLKTYLYYYQLLAEICLRPEINPPGAEIKITPLAVMGKMYTESGLCTSSGYTGFKDGTLLWQTEASIISQCDLGNVRDMLKPHAAGTYTYEQYLNQFSSTAAPYACGGPVGQSYITSFNWDSNANAIAAIYISKEENPTLEDEKRGVVGTRSEIYGDGGIYANADFWENQGKCEKADYEDIKSAIKQGIFDKNTPMGYKTRPATYFVPDACYTLCLSMRAALEDKSPLNFYYDFNKYYSNLIDITGVDAADANTQYVMQALSLYPQLTPASSEALINTTNINSHTIGAVAELYGDFLYNKISFVPVKDLPSSDAILMCTSAPANIVAKMVGGVDSIYNWDDLATELPSSYKVGSTTITPIFYQLRNSKWEHSLFKCEYALSNSYTAPYNAVTAYSGELGAGMWYSFNCLNIGYLLQESCDAHIRYAHSLWGTPSTPEGMIDGHTCLGDDCWHLKYPEESRSISINSASDVKADKVYAEVLSNTDKLNLSVLRPMTIKSADHNNKAIFSGLALPVTFENGQPPELLVFATYSNHAGDAVDFHVETYDEQRTTATSEIHAIADGYIVEIRQFPYYKRTTFSAAQQLFQQICARTDGNFGYAQCGNMVKVMHVADDGSVFYSRYLHLRDFAHISVGSVIEKGGLLGYTGTTGFSTGEHPHITVLNYKEASIGYLNFVKSYLYDLAPDAVGQLSTKYAQHSEYLFVIKRKEDEENKWEYYETRYNY